MAHLKFAVLRIAETYPDDFNTSTLLITPDLKTTLEKITPVFYSAFRERYAGEYSGREYALKLIMCLNNFSVR